MKSLLFTISIAISSIIASAQQPRDTVPHVSTLDSVKVQATKRTFGITRLKAVDGEALDALDQAAVSYQIVLTKSDRVTAPDLAAQLATLQRALARRPAAYPSTIATAAETGAGIAELRAAISRLHERG